MIDFYIGLFLATLITALFTTRLYRLLLWYGLNSIFLALVGIETGITLHDRALLITGVLTLVLKGIVLPYVLKILASKFKLTRQIQPNIKIPYSILLVPAIIVFTYYLTSPIALHFSEHQTYISLSISALLLSLLLMLEHTNIAPKIVGFLMMENALFLLGISATEGMPMIVELGVFFDLLMAVVVINLLLRAEHV